MRIRTGPRDRRHPSPLEERSRRTSSFRTTNRWSRSKVIASSGSRPLRAGGSNALGQEGVVALLRATHAERLWKFLSMTVPRHDLLSTNENRLSVDSKFTDALTGPAQRRPHTGVTSTNSAPRMTVIDFAEARKTKRRRILDTGLIRFGDMSICCVVRNLSEAGAALDIGSQVGVPDKFTLIVAPKKKIYSCAVVWRKERRIGVAFC